MKEKWVQINKIQGFEDIREWYYLSNSDEDKIINKNTGKQLKGSFDNKGYKVIGLRTNQGKTKFYRIHVLKAKAFLYTPNPLNVNVVRHLDDCRTNNTLTNLTWGTFNDNMQDCIRNGHYNYEAAIRGLVIGGAKGRAKGHTKGSIRGGAIVAKKYSKPVRCIETNIIYPSCIEAERQTGVSNGNINKCCSGRRHTAGGFHWEFVNQISE